MKFRALALLSLSALAVSAATGCVWITEDEIAAFNDRDNDGLDHNEDCDDNNKQISATVKWYPDVDNDGFGDMDADPVDACPDSPPKELTNPVRDNTDCNDNDANALPGGTEVCDPQNIDEDCDGSADDADAEAEGKVTWYPDSDGDTYGDETASGVLACDPPSGTEVTDNSDCDDSLDFVNPAATEVCDPDNVDEDCSGSADDADGGVDASTFIQYYGDADSDTYGNPDVVGALQCDPPGGQAPNNGDCNDADPDINPGATEVCDAADVDEDCDALSDDDDTDTDTATMSLWYPDLDGDTYGDMNAAARQACDPAVDEVADNTDCDDSLDHVYPTAPELCDDNMPVVDEDCDGLTNDADPDAQQSDWWPDNDGDGWGADGPAAATSCLPPADHVGRPGDCNDAVPTINPDAHEYHDGVDSDCDALSSDFICGQAYLRVGSGEPFTTIQSAVDAIDQVTYCDGDTIEVLPGTYVENVTVADKSPNIRGLVGPLSTFIVGTGTGRVVNLDRTGALFEGFTVTGGSVTGDGGGVRVFYGNGTVVNDLIVTGNWASGNGGGIEVRNPESVTISNSTIGGPLPTPLVGADFNETSSGDGGGIRVSSTGGQAAGTILLSGLNIINNVSGDEGGGLRVLMDAASAVTVVVEDTVIENNSAITAGGLAAELVPALELRRVDLVDNVGQANIGGALVKNSGLLVEGLMLDGNQSVTVSGLQVSNFVSPVTLRDVVALDNILTGPNGSGHTLFIRGDETHGTVVDNVEVARTIRSAAGVGQWGAGLIVEGKLDASNVLIYDEAGAAGLEVAGVPAGSPTTHSVVNATLVGNVNDGILVSAPGATSISLNNVISAHNGGYGIGVRYIDPTVLNSDLFDNSDGNFGGTNNPIGSNGVISADPLFADFNAFAPSLDWDLTLGSGSPCIDTGDTAISDPDSSRSDMGYYGGPGAP